MKVAIIVEYNFKTRIIVDEDEDDFRKINDLARESILNKVNTELGRNFCGWFKDKTNPYIEGE